MTSAGNGACAWKGITLRVIVASRPKISFLSDGSTSLGNYRYHPAKFQTMSKHEKIPSSIFWDVTLCGSCKKMAFFIVTAVKTSNLTYQNMSEGGSSSDGDSDSDVIIMMLLHSIFNI
jgi:hypothetical protein